MSKKYTLLIFKGICMNFLLELNFFILSHPVTSKQRHKIIQIHISHPVLRIYKFFHEIFIAFFLRYKQLKIGIFFNSLISIRNILLYRKVNR